MNRLSHRRAAVVSLLSIGLGAGCLVGCADQPKGMTGNASVDSANKDLQANQRIMALESMWKDAAANPDRLKLARNASKDVLWKSAAPDVLRQRAWELLLTDTSEAGLADTQKFLSLRLPTESQWRIVKAYCESIVSRASDPGWRTVTASLVRSYARKVPAPPDDQRPERDALLATHPGSDLTSVVFDVFVHPSENGAPKYPDDSAQRSREAAWDLLGRLDPDGSRRAVLASGATSNDPAIRDINRCAHDLGVVPITGSELNWMRGLMDDKDRRNAAWWTETSSAVGRLGPEQRRGLRLRHLEPLRWATANKPEWVRAPREQLYAELTRRLEGRRIWLNTEGSIGMDGKSHEMPRDWANELTWGDLLSILVIDEAIHHPGMPAELFAQAFADQADTTTEYGGLLWSADQGGVVPGSARGAKSQPAAGAFAVRSYQPRPTERKDDRTFIAPEEMFTDSARAIAHYHFHVQSPNNSDYAGPGRGDLDYATMHGRNCVVFTSVREGVMDADYYQSNGVVIDLGEITNGK
jgi:hypothetical protein